MRRIALIAVLALVLGGCAFVTRADVRTDGSTDATAGTGVSEFALSEDGSVVYFVTGARLVAADTDTVPDLYRRDVRRGRTELVRAPIPPDGTNFGALHPDTDRAGSLVAFTTVMPIEPDDTHDLAPDVYVYDTARAHFTRVSVLSDGSDIPNHERTDAPLISGEGTDVAFTVGDDQGDRRLFVRDLGGATTTEVPIEPSDRLIGITDDGSRLLTRDSAGMVRARDWRIDNVITVPCPATSAAILRSGDTVIADFVGGGECHDHIAELDLNQPDSYNDISSAHGTLVPRSMSENDQYVYRLVSDPTANPADVGQIMTGSSGGQLPQRLSDSPIGIPATTPIGAWAVSADGTVGGFTTSGAIAGVAPTGGPNGLYLHASFRPRIDLVSPATLARGATNAPVEVFYLAPVTGTTTVDFGPGIHVKKILNGWQVSVDPAAKRGLRDVVVTWHGPIGVSIGICGGCFRIT